MNKDMQKRKSVILSLKIYIAMEKKYCTEVTVNIQGFLFSYNGLKKSLIEFDKKKKRIISNNLINLINLKN